MNTMKLPDFDYSIVTVDGISFVVMKDLDRGGVSLTNAIDQAFANVVENSKRNDLFHVCLYADSEGRYDAYDTENFVFIPIGGYDRAEAISSFIARVLSNFITIHNHTHERS